MQAAVLYGAGTRIRTADLLITNQLLCQLSYAGIYEFPATRIIRFCARGGKAPAFNNRIRLSSPWTGCRVAQQNFLFSVFCDHRAGASARW